jgi:hypothetical protein
MTSSLDFAVKQLAPPDTGLTQGQPDVFREAFENPDAHHPAVALYTQLRVREEVLRFDLPVEGV